MNRVRAVSEGALWNYGAQAATVVAQFAYAAAAARIIDGAGFGAYAVALLVSGFIGMFTSGGLVQAVSRMQKISPQHISPLNTYAIILGISAAGFLFLSARLWAHAWNSPEAAEPIRLFALNLLFSPGLAVVTGVMLRAGRFRAFAISSAVSSIGGMTIGIIAVSLSGAAWALATAPVATAILAFSILHSATKFRYARPGRLKSGTSDLIYSLNVTLSNLLSYISNSAAKWSVTTGISTAALGQWNRAESVSTVPMYSAQTALLQVIFPEFRHHIDDVSRARRIWPDLIELVAWITIPFGCILAVVLPILIPALFGPGWDQAAAISPILGLSAGIQPIIAILNNAVLAIGRRSWLLATEFAVMACQAIVSGLVLLFGDLTIAIWGVIAGGIVQHAVQVGMCAHHGYIPLLCLIKKYTKVAILGITTFVVASIASASVTAAATAPAYWVGIVAGFTTVCLGLWLARRSLPPWRIAVQYGLLKPKTS